MTHLQIQERITIRAVARTRTTQATFFLLSIKFLFATSFAPCYLSGENDHHQSFAIRLEIDDKIENSRPKETILDFTDVTFMDSSGIGLVMGRYKLCSQYEGSLTVCGLSDSTYKVMKLAGLSNIASIKKGGIKNEHK